MSQKSNSDRFEFQLGAVVENVQTGLTGVVTAVGTHLTGCERYGVLPSESTGTSRSDEQFYYPQELEQLKSPEDGPYSAQADTARTELDIDLGQIAADDISAVEGYVTTITYQLFNCPRVAIQPSSTEPTERAEREFFDAPRMTVVGDGLSDEYDGLRADAQDTEMAAAATGAPESDLDTKTDLA